MTGPRKTLQKLLAGTRDANVRFRELQHLLKALGFVERIRGSHYIYTRDDIVEIINIQPRGAQAKPYQVKHIRELILKYRLGDSL